MFGNIVGAGTARRRDPPVTNKKINAHMGLNNYGKIVQSVLNTLPKRFPIKMDVQQIMPNHIHFIIILESGGSRVKYLSGGSFNAGASRPDFIGAVRAPTKSHALGFIVGLFKSESTKQIRKLLNEPNKRIFQRNYYEHIIKNEREYKQIVYYIRNNPQNWDTDKNNLNKL